MKRTPFAAKVLLAATVLVALPAQHAMAQARGGAKAAGQTAAAKGGTTSRPTVSPAQSPKQVSQSPKQVSQSPKQVSQSQNVVAQNPKVAGPAKGTKAVTPKGKGTVAGNSANRPISNQSAYGFTAPGFQTPIIIGGLGFGFGNSFNSGFDPYVLQGWSNMSPAVYSSQPSLFGATQYSPYAATQPSPFAGRTPYVEPANIAVQNYPPIIGRSTLNAPNIELGPPPIAATATVQVIVPTPNAELWFNGIKTQTAGQKREFVTPELPPGQTFTYEIRLRWSLNGKDYEQTRVVNVQAGAQSVLNFLDPREQLPVPLGIKI